VRCTAPSSASRSQPPAGAADHRRHGASDRHGGRTGEGALRRRQLGDSGVSTRLFGSLLTYLADHESDVFFVATSNDISKLPPELGRAERFDAIFCLDLPASAEKDRIWSIHRTHFEIPADQARPDDTDWTGAEIRSCCRLSALLDVPLTQAARQVVPVAVTAAEQVEKLRTWASGRCLSASEPGIYTRDGGSTVTKPAAACSAVPAATEALLSGRSAWLLRPFFLTPFLG